MADILTSFAVGSYVSSHDDPWYLLSFMLVTLFLLALPSLLIVAFGERAESLPPKVRDWMNNNSWVVSEIVIALFIGLTASSLAA